MDLRALRAILNAEPPRTDAEYVAWLSEFVDVSRPVSSRDLLGWAAVGDRLDRLESARSSAQTGDARTRAHAAYLLITREDTTLDWAKHGPLVQAMAMEGTFTAEEAAELQALCTEQVPRWRSLGLAEAPSVDSVTRARVMPWP